MSTQVGGFRTLAFGELDGGLWGAAVDAGSGGSAGLAFGSGDARAALAAPALQWTAERRGWTLAGDGVTLEVEPLGDEPEEREARSEPEVSGVQELCRVRGTVTIGASAHQVDCTGTRTEVDGLAPGAVASARSVSGWFADDEALTLLALRARHAVDHDGDMIAATLFDPNGWVPVLDPRLSTTYTDAGVPARTSLELWVGDGEDEFPRRAAGEAAGALAECSCGDLELRVAPLRCHSRGLEGSGVYVLARF